MDEQAIDTAVQLLAEQQNRLEQIRNLDYQHPDFKLWQDTTMTLFQRFIRPDSPHFIRFRDIRFLGKIQISIARRLPYNYRGPSLRQNDANPQDQEQFQKGCDEAHNCIQGAIKEVETFGVHVEINSRTLRQKTGGGVQQTFHGPVTIENQIIATDKAIQNIGHIGNTGTSLKEIAGLINQSLELTGKQRLEALEGIEIIASETGKPEEHRNWKSIAEWAEKILAITGKATDVANKLAPHLPFLTALVHAAKARFGL